MNIIGKPPIRYWNKLQLSSMNRFGLMNIVDENGWEDLISDWDNTPEYQIVDIISARMMEDKQEVKR